MWRPGKVWLPYINKLDSLIWLLKLLKKLLVKWRLIRLIMVVSLTYGYSMLGYCRNNISYVAVTKCFSRPVLLTTDFWRTMSAFGCFGSNCYWRKTTSRMLWRLSNTFYSGRGHSMTENSFWWRMLTICSNQTQGYGNCISTCSWASVPSRQPKWLTNAVSNIVVWRQLCWWTLQISSGTMLTSNKLFECSSSP